MFLLSLLVLFYGIPDAFKAFLDDSAWHRQIEANVVLRISYK